MSGISIEINGNGSAFDESGGLTETARILRDIANKLEESEFTGNEIPTTIYDLNGNVCGEIIDYNFFGGYN